MRTHDEFIMELPLITQKVKELLLLAGVNMLKVNIKEGVGTYFEKRTDGKQYFFNYTIVFRTMYVEDNALIDLKNYFKSGNAKLIIELDFTKD